VDLVIEADVSRVVEILKAVGFESISVKNAKVIEAKLRDGWGRIHVLGVGLGANSTYLDVHRDSPIHIAFIGVDYARRPREVCEKILQHAARMGVRGAVIGGTSWFNRKNKAVFRGVRF